MEGGGGSQQANNDRFYALTERALALAEKQQNYSIQQGVSTEQTQGIPASFGNSGDFQGLNGSSFNGLSGGGFGGTSGGTGGGGTGTAVPGPSGSVDPLFPPNPNGS